MTFQGMQVVTQLQNSYSSSMLCTGLVMRSGLICAALAMDFSTKALSSGSASSMALISVAILLCEACPAAWFAVAVCSALVVGVVLCVLPHPTSRVVETNRARTPVSSLFM